MMSSSAKITKRRRVAAESKSNQAPPEVPKRRRAADERKSNQPPPEIPKRRRAADERKSNQPPPEVPKRRRAVDERKSNQPPPEVPKRRRVADEEKSKQAPPKIPKRRVGLLYDERMCKHVRLAVEVADKQEQEVEIPERIRAIWKKLKDDGITERCKVMRATKALDEHIKSVHSLDYINSVKYSRTLASPEKRNATTKDSGIHSKSAYLAAGSVQKASEMVAEGKLDSAIAIVRPPGHHAEEAKAMGFCYFNNVAIAASYLLSKSDELNLRKLLIVDWDVHHGNGTQKMFYKNDQVLTFSVHRFDSGEFYPQSNDGSHRMIGRGSGKGYNINVPWQHGKLRDADYLAVWDHILIPVTKAFNPDMILVSAGFDAAKGDLLGKCFVTPVGFSYMLTKLMKFAQGKIVMALEGGYDHESTANSVLACAKSLLGENPTVKASKAKPYECTWNLIQKVRNQLRNHWPDLASEIPQFSAENSLPCRKKTCRGGS